MKPIQRRVGCDSEANAWTEGARPTTTTTNFANAPLLAVPLARDSRG